MASSSEFKACAHLLGGSDLTRFVDHATGRIDFETMEKESAMFSGGERVLMDLAFALWTGIDREQGVGAALVNLDQPNWQRFLQAIEIRRGVTV